MLSVKVCLVLIFCVRCLLGCLCGVSQSSEPSHIETRIIGGQEADIHEFPWAALLVILTGGAPLRCGGTLINDRLLQTAIIIHPN